MAGKDATDFNLENVVSEGTSSASLPVESQTLKRNYFADHDCLPIKKRKIIDHHLFDSFDQYLMYRIREEPSVNDFFKSVEKKMLKFSADWDSLTEDTSVPKEKQQAMINYFETLEVKDQPTLDLTRVFEKFNEKLTDLEEWIEAQIKDGKTPDKIEIERLLELHKNCLIQDIELELKEQLNIVPFDDCHSDTDDSDESDTEISDGKVRKSVCLDHYEGLKTIIGDFVEWMAYYFDTHAGKSKKYFMSGLHENLCSISDEFASAFEDLLEGECDIEMVNEAKLE